ncbi:ubiquitin carboxyl-terminal hydrolase 47-like, partial [Saccoglossus kowalevskii]
MLPGESNQLVATEVSCVADAPKILCIIRDTTNPQWQTCNITINLPASCPCRELHDEVARHANYETDSFSLVWIRGGQDTDEILLNGLGEKTLLECGMQPNKIKNYLQIRDRDGEQPIPIPVSKDVSTCTEESSNSSLQG